MTKDSKTEFRLKILEESLKGKASAADVKTLKEDVKLIMTNHLPHIYTDVKGIKTDVAWIKKWFWLIAASSVGALVSSVLGLIIKK